MRNITGEEAQILYKSATEDPLGGVHFGRGTTRQIRLDEMMGRNQGSASALPAANAGTINRGVGAAAATMGKVPATPKPLPGGTASKNPFISTMRNLFPSPKANKLPITPSAASRTYKSTIANNM